MAGFKDTLDGISRKKWGPILGVVLAFIVGFLLLVYVAPMVCFGYLIVAAAVFFIPYYFGLKKFKQLAIWGIVFIVLAPLPWGAFLVDQYNDFGEKGYTASSVDDSIVNGHVTPYYYDEENNVYTFTVEADEKYATVMLHIENGMKSAKPEKYVMMNTHEKTEDGKNIFSMSFDNLAGGMYIYYFEGKVLDGDREVESVKTNALTGPITYDNGSLYIDTLKGIYPIVVIYVGLLYFLMAYFVWSSQRNKKILDERRAQNQPKEGSDGKFYCPKCNSEVIKGQRFCPQCGENFSVDPMDAKPATTPFKGADEDYFCTECGTKVDEDAKVCPGCGRKFE